MWGLVFLRSSEQAAYPIRREDYPHVWQPTRARALGAAHTLLRMSPRRIVALAHLQEKTNQIDAVELVPKPPV